MIAPRITTRVGQRETYLEQTAPMEITIWQSMGQFHRMRVSNDGTIRPGAAPQWILKLLTRHAAELRSWCGFTDTRRADVPWESYIRKVQA